MPTPLPKMGAAVRVGESITLSLADARKLPAGDAPRLHCRHYSAPPRLLPNGLPRTTPLYADALLLIGDAFLVTARVLRDGPDAPPSRLQVEREALDTATGQRVLMPIYAPGLLRAAYDVLTSQQVLLNARRQARERRN